jgi:hypothetical protein
MSKNQKRKCTYFYNNKGLVLLLTKLGREYFNLEGDIFNNYAMQEGSEVSDVQA